MSAPSFGARSLVDRFHLQRAPPQTLRLCKGICEDAPPSLLREARVRGLLGAWNARPWLPARASTTSSMVMRAGVHAEEVDLPPGRLVGALEHALQLRGCQGSRQSCRRRRCRSGRARGRAGPWRKMRHETGTLEGTTVARHQVCDGVRDAAEVRVLLRGIAALTRFATVETLSLVVRAGPIFG